MITYRDEKGYALTHEELDENFRTFDPSEIEFTGIAKWCPEGDKYVISIEKDTSANYVLVGDSSFQSGIMTSTPVSGNIKAIVPESREIDHTVDVSPKPFTEFSLVETQQKQYDDSTPQTIGILFSQIVDLIEVELNITNVPETHTSASYVNGYLLGIDTYSTGYYNAHSVSGDNSNLVFNVISQATIPTISNDNDPFGDSSQVHYFKFDGDVADELANGIITGSGTAFVTDSLIGDQSLKLYNENELELDLIDTDFQNNDGFTLIYTGIRGNNQQMIALNDPDNTSKSRTILSLSKNDIGYKAIGTSTGAHYHYTYPEDKEWTTDAFGYGSMLSGGFLLGDFTPSDYTWITSAYTLHNLSNGLLDFSIIGWDGYKKTTATYVSTETKPINDFSGGFPDHISFNKGIDASTSWNNEEVYLDVLRVFNRPLTGLEQIAITSPSNGENVNVYNTDETKIITYASVYKIDESAPGVDIDLIKGSNLVSLGDATVDFANRKITYQYRVSMISDSFTFNIKYSDGDINGDTITVRGYKANG